MIALADVDDAVLARSYPAGFARYASFGKWEIADHLLLIQAYLLELVYGDIDNLIISMPPRHGKSMFVSTYFPCWYLGTHPNHNVILASYEAGLASMFGGRVRDLMAEFGASLWGLRVRPDKRAASDWELVGKGEDGTPVVGGMRSAGVGSGVTGRGANLVIIDDPVKDAEQAQSERYRQRVWDWYLATLFTRREPGCKQLCVMTRWHEDDLAGRLKDRAEEQSGIQWHELALPAIAEEKDDGDELGRSVNDVLWPERWPLDQLETVRDTMSAYWFGALYQQRPAPAEGNIFRRDWWRFWVPPELEGKLPPVRLSGTDKAAEVVVRPEMQRVAQSWDLTFKKGEDTAFVVGQTWGRAGPDAYLLDEDRARRSFPETVDAVRSFAQRWDEVSAIWIEDAANAQATMAVLSGEVSGMIPVRVEGSKEDRALAISAYPEAGNVVLPHPAVAPWVVDYIEELASFPNGRYADRVDCTSQALRRIFTTEEKKRLVWGKRHHRR